MFRRVLVYFFYFLFFKQKTAYEMRISDWSSDVCSSDLDKLSAGGVTRCLAVPGMLFAAGHAKNDIPSVLNTYQAQHTEMTIDYGREQIGSASCRERVCQYV